MEKKNDAQTMEHKRVGKSILLVLYILEKKKRNKI